MRQWLRDIRVARKMSEARVARALGVSQVTYHFYETGKRTPTVPIAKKLGALLDFNWTRLYDEPEEAEEAS